MRSLTLIALAVLIAGGGAAACAAERPAAAPKSATATPAPVTSTVPAATFVMPNLTGLLWQDAFPMLQSLGWTGALHKLSDVAESDWPPGVIVTQEPVAGMGVHSSDVITLAFAAE